MQAIVSLAEGEAGEALVGGAGAALGRNGEGGAGGVGTWGGGMRGGRVERDIRENDEYLYDESKRAGQTASLGLFAQLEEADRKWAGNGGRGRAKSEGAAEVATCPVCGKFEGDEAAVAHHVEGHFAE